MIDDELINFLNLIVQLRPDLEENLNKLRNTLDHSAPEILLKKYWNGIYIILQKNVVVKVDVHDNNRIIFDKYHELYEKHK